MPRALPTAKLSKEQKVIVQANIGLAWARSRTWAKRLRVSIYDLIGEATIALARAAQKVDPAKGKLSTYAYKAIDRRIWRWFQIRTKKNPVLFGRISDHEDHAINMHDAVEASDVWHRCMMILDARERKVIAMWLGQGKKLDEIASVIGLTRQRIQQIEVAAINKCREALLETECA